MSITISLDQFPRQVESLLRVAWEKHESIILERKGKPMAAVLPMEEYLRLYSEAKKVETTKALSELSYELPADLLDAYHSLLNKKFSYGLTPDEEAELVRIDQQLDNAELATPLVQSTLTKTAHKHEQWMRTLNEVISKLRDLRESP